MDLAVAFDAEELDDHKRATHAALQVLKDSARNYAESALYTAQAILDIATEGGPVAATYGMYEEVTKYCSASNEALAAYAQLSNLLTRLNESADDEATHAYGMYLVDDAEATIISALLEGTTRRLNLVASLTPRPALPGTRFRVPPPPPPPPANAKPSEPS